MNAPDIHGTGVRIWRWIVFGLAGFYSVYMVWTGDYSAYPLGPFRYLTIWALFFSFFSASRMLALSEHRSDRQWEPVVATTAVMNVMVVYLYWSLYFRDPSLVNTGPVKWWIDDYLHFVGPVLQWIDVLFVWRGFRRVLPAAGVLLAVILAYVGWAELVIRPISSRPVGTVTAGLPYPFLNDMTLHARLLYYTTIGVAALVVLGVVWGMARLVRGSGRR